jgi:predicted Fe-Mo cluster-binding NifX family protein
MKTALTIWEDRISPVFDSASKLLIARIEEGAIKEKYYVSFHPEPPYKLAERLVDMEVSVLFCGAISQRPATIIENSGIELVPFVTGPAFELLEAFARREPVTPKFSMPGCRGNHGQGCMRKRMHRGDGQGKNGLCRGFAGTKDRFNK